MHDDANTPRDATSEPRVTETYEPPAVEDLDTREGASVTSAGTGPPTLVG